MILGCSVLEKLLLQGQVWDAEAPHVVPDHLDALPPGDALRGDVLRLGLLRVDPALDVGVECAQVRLCQLLGDFVADRPLVLHPGRRDGRPVDLLRFGECSNDLAAVHAEEDRLISVVVVDHEFEAVDFRVELRGVVHVGPSVAGQNI